MKNFKNLLIALLAIVTLFGAVATPFLANAEEAKKEETTEESAEVAEEEVTEEAAEEEPAEEEPAEEATEEDAKETKNPKYVFLFIGDGMSFVQVQLANYYNTIKNEGKSDILRVNENLNFMDFDVCGTATTYDSTSFCPDSASTASSIASGIKTHSGSINVDENGEGEFKTIAEKVKAQLDWKVGVISTVNLNHATPAAFYAHQEKRGDYYEIGLELIESGFDYFAGGGLKQIEGPEGDQANLYELAQEAGYKFVNSNEDAKAVTAEDEKVLIIDEFLADGDAMAYEIDRTEDMLSLADYTAKGIEVLNNDEGFFMMVESGKIDWSCHANDAATTIHDTLAFADSIQVAIDFAEEHPEETLILVTGDHETGALSIGFAGTGYDTFLDLIDNQKISQTAFDMTVLPEIVEEEKSFEDVLAIIEENFGLKTEGEEDDLFVLTEAELKTLEEAYNTTFEMIKNEDYEMSYEDYLAYGGYTPLTVKITQMLNNKCGIQYGSYSHTGVPVAVYANGCGAEEFFGHYDNTGIHDRLATLLNVQ